MQRLLPADQFDLHRSFMDEFDTSDIVLDASMFYGFDAEASSAPDPGVDESACDGRALRPVSLNATVPIVHII